MPSTTGLGFQFFQQARLSKHVGVGWAVTSKRDRHSDILIMRRAYWELAFDDITAQSALSHPRTQQVTTLPRDAISDWPQFSGLMAFIFNLSRCFRVRLYGFVFLSHSTRLAIFFLRLQCQGPAFKSINCQIWIFFISSCSPFQFRSWKVKNVFTKC